MNYPNFKVCVRCSTYNQSKYITDALNGFAMQQTDFPFICCIVDDASTDGEQKVIRQYLKNNCKPLEAPERIPLVTDYADIDYARHNTNQNCYFAVWYLKENHNRTPELKNKKLTYLSQWIAQCRYQALCEGDDYWIDPCKLKKQYDFMETHPHYAMCCHNTKEHTSAGVRDSHLPKKEFDISTCLAFIEWDFPTPSVFINRNIFSNYMLFSTGAPIGDGPQLIYAAIYGKIRYMKDVMCVYRVESNGSWTERMKKSPEKMLDYRKKMAHWLRYADNFTHNTHHKYFEYLASLQEARIEKAKGGRVSMPLTRIKLWIKLRFTASDLHTVISQLLKY